MINKNQNPLLSVIIPTYQCQETIERCVTSIAKQEIINKEIIVIDDGSTDSTIEICLGLQKTTPYLFIYKQENRGASHARNRGLHLARGEFIHFIDGDDYVIDGGYDILLNSRITDSVDFISFNYKTFDKISKNYIYIDLFGLKKDIFRIFSINECKNTLISTSVTPWNKIISRRFLFDYGIIFEDIQYANDRRFHFEVVIKAKKVALCGTILVAHEVNNRKSLSNQPGYKRFQCSIKSLESILSISINQDERIIRLIFDRCMMDLLHEYNRINNIGERTFAIKHIGELLTQPERQSYFKHQDQSEWFSLFQIAAIKTYHDNQNKTALPIVMVCNDSYAPYLSVAITSIKLNLKYNVRVNIYVLHKGLKKETGRFLTEQHNNENFMVNLVNISGLPNTLDHIKSRHYTKEIYDRLWIPYLFGHFDKVLYLDCDLVVLKSIHHIFRYNIKNKLIAGIRDFNNEAHHRYVSKILKVNPDNYINSGVILFNPSACLQHKLRERCLDELKKYDELSCPDQDVINIVCAGKIGLIDSGWNYLWSYGFMERRDPPDGYAWFTDDLINAKQKKHIIHYSSAFKPWLYPLYEDADLFWKYARLSPSYARIAQINLQNKIKDIRDRLKQLSFQH